MRVWCGLLIGLASLLFGPGAACRAQSELNGAGSTFVRPMIQKWSREYLSKTNKANLNYLPKGSGAGVEMMTKQVVDFGCTDAPMSPKQLAAAKMAGGEVIHVPLVMGAVVLTYNVPGLNQPLRVTGPLLADMYRGAIRFWDHEDLSDLNPGVKLPHEPIVPVYRKESSGTSFIFTEYLSKVSEPWSKQIGASTKPELPRGVAKEGNAEVANHVKNTPWSIGYVEFRYALERGLPVATLKNRTGNYVEPSLQRVTAATEGSLKEIPDNLQFSLTNASGRDAYPISGTVWAVFYKKQKKERGKILVEFLRWAVAQEGGQNYATDLHYAPLPVELIKRIEAKLDSVEFVD